MPRDDAPGQLVPHAMRRHWRAFAIVVIVISLAVAAVAVKLPTSYTSTAEILVQPLTGNALSTSTNSSSSQTTTIAMDTEARLVGSSAVAAQVNQSLDTSVPAGSSHLSTTVPSNSQIIQISYTADSARTAQRIAQAFAESFLAYRSNLAQVNQKAQLDKLNQQAAAVQTQLNKALSDARLPHPPADNASKIGLYSSNLASLTAKISQSQTPPDQPGSVVTPASLPSNPTGINKVLIVVAGIVLALVLGLLFALWRERRDDRLRASDERYVLDLPVLATVPPRTKRAAGGIDAKRADAIRRARTGILAAARPNSVIAVSAVGRRGSADVTAELSRSLSAAGYRTVLVDASIDGPHVAAVLGIARGPGLAEVLSGTELDLASLREIDGLRVLPCGADPDSARELYSSAAAAALIEKLRSDSDFVLVNTSPMPSGDGLAIALAADYCVFIATDHDTTHDRVCEARDLVRRLDVSVLGLLIMQDRAVTVPVASTGRSHKRPGGAADQPPAPRARKKEPPAPDDDERPEDDPNPVAVTNSSATASNGARNGQQKQSRPGGRR